MHVEALDLSNSSGVVIMIFGRTILAEADDLPIASGGQHPPTSGRLRTHNLAPIAHSVRGESLAVPRLGRTIPICHLPCTEVQVPQRRGLDRICRHDLHVCRLTERGNRDNGLASGHSASDRPVLVAVSFAG
jgi:hypothetical protein